MVRLSPEYIVKRRKSAYILPHFIVQFDVFDSAI